MFFNVLVTYIFGILSYTKLILQKKKKKKMKHKTECNI